MILFSILLENMTDKSLRKSVSRVHPLRMLRELFYLVSPGLRQALLFIVVRDVAEYVAYLLHEALKSANVSLLVVKSVQIIIQTVLFVLLAFLLRLWDSKQSLQPSGAQAMDIVSE